MTRIAIFAFSSSVLSCTRHGTIPRSATVQKVGLSVVSKAFSTSPRSSSSWAYRALNFSRWGYAKVVSNTHALRALPASKQSWSNPRASMSMRAATELSVRPIQLAAGRPDVVSELQEAFRILYNSNSLDKHWQSRLTQAAFPFELDKFQTDALDSLVDGKSVVLAAPTGAGKTIVGEMAVYIALARGLRVFYTTPLKALSNQKFYDFRKQFGEERVGLLTGDVTVNREADVVVMTTEVYRNMLYGESFESDNVTLLTDRLYAVVFDEFHFLNDRSRGTVWEESVINSPDHVLLVALSATMSNTADIRDWFAEVQGPTALIETQHRPVPLQFGFCNSDGINPLFADNAVLRGHGISSSALRKGFKQDKKKGRKSSLPKLHPLLLRSLQEHSVLRETSRFKGRRSSKGSRSPSETLAKALSDTKSLDKLIKTMKMASKNDSNGRTKDQFVDVPSFPFVVRSLRKRKMLPCIVFIFSRAGCDRAALAAGEEKVSLVSGNEKIELSNRLNDFAAQHPDLVQPDRLMLAKKGIASHHAGLLPIWKLCVEELFQDGLIKVVFATETLAAGINMPARTTVISALSKRTGAEGIVSLTTSEVLQMAGRAGRRGKDVLGHSVILRSRFEGVLDAFRVVTADVDALKSQFMPTYGMVLNLLQTRNLSDSKQLIQRSFGNFLKMKRAAESESAKKNAKENDNGVGREFEKAALEAVLTTAEEILSTTDISEIRSYVKSLERVKAEKRVLSYLENQSRAKDGKLVEDTLIFAPSGTRILLKNPKPVGSSKGAMRRRKKRDYNEALSAARNGDNGAELYSFYLLRENDECLESDVLEPQSEKTGTREAVLLDMHVERLGGLPMFVAIDDYGTMRIFNHTHVDEMLYDDEVLNLDDEVPGWRDAPLPDRSEWNHLGEEQYSADVPADLEALAKKAVEWQTNRRPTETVHTKNDENEEPAADVLMQRRKVDEAVHLAKQHPLYVRGEGAKLIRAKQVADKVRETIVNEYSEKKIKNNKNVPERAGTDQNENNVSVIDDSFDDSSWGDFLAIVSVLQQYGFIDDQYAVTGMGEIGAKIRTDNELWASLVVMHPILESISPVHMGAIIGAVQIEDGGRGDVYVAHEPSQAVLEIAQALLPIRARLYAMQSEYGVDAAVPLDTELIGVIEAWASGVSWTDLLNSTSLQEGDICRMLRRVLDLLRQIPHLPGISEGVKKNAKRAITLLDRFPVTDDLTYVVRDNEKLYGQSGKKERLGEYY